LTYDVRRGRPRVAASAELDLHHRGAVAVAGGGLRVREQDGLRILDGQGHRGGVRADRPRVCAEAGEDDLPDDLGGPRHNLVDQLLAALATQPGGERIAVVGKSPAAAGEREVDVLREAVDQPVHLRERGAALERELGQVWDLV
jgi:hypothetical protein